MKKYTQVEDNLLDISNPIYDILSSANAPVWWHNVKNDNSLYIEIRKDNYLDVYFKGGCVAKISYNQRKKHFVVVTHPKYLNRKEKNNPAWFNKRVKDGKIVYEAIYQDCTEWLENPSKLEILKNNVTENYSGNEEGENTSEKLIQSKLIIKHKNKYLDSEFAYRFYDNHRNTIRIDLVRIENDMFVFEELKRIKDCRLRTTKGDPEIYTQMTNYEGFIRQNQKALTTYYQTLYKIKIKMGLPVPPVENIESICVNPQPTLLIINNYDEISTGKADRISSITSFLEQKHINFDIRTEI